MNRFRRCSLAIACAVSLSAPFALAQETPAAPAQQPPRQPSGPRPSPTNIKALPKDISGDDLIKIMRQFTGDLGVECAFCHAQNPQTKRIDFASDANPVKETARVMIRMNADINTKFLTQVKDRMSTDPVTCGTCHRGNSMPEVFVPKPRERGNRPPGTPAQPATPPTTPN